MFCEVRDFLLHFLNILWIELKVVQYAAGKKTKSYK